MARLVIPEQGKAVRLGRRDVGCGSTDLLGQNDYLTKILFTKAHCLSHDVNKLTRSPTHIDVIMGFSTGEIIWWEPVSQRYTRLNKNVGHEPARAEK
jgi:hypothetical protein